MLDNNKVRSQNALKLFVKMKNSTTDTLRLSREVRGEDGTVNLSTPTRQLQVIF